MPTHHLSIRARIIILAVLLCAVLSYFLPGVAAQSIGFKRDVGREMLATMRDRIKARYYDLSFRGVDLEARFKAADEQIKQATSMEQMYGIIGGFALSLDDPHTRFYPPARNVTYDQGWTIQMIGEACYVTGVRPGSDAENRGLKPGDQVLSVAGEPPTREGLWRTHYFLEFVRPLPSVRLTVRSPGGEPRELEPVARVNRPYRATDLKDMSGMQRQRVEDAKNNQRPRPRIHEVGNELLIWKMPRFDLSKYDVNDLFGRIRKFKNLVIDLRGTAGGYDDETMLAIVANLFDRDVKIGEYAARKERKPIVAKTRGKQAFTGKVILLVDSGSEGYAELFARVLQTEKRGVVIGDKTLGRLMRERYYDEQIGAEAVVRYGTNIAEADVILTDGKSLENVGVMPDELLLPSPADLAAGRDPVLVRTFELAGVPVDAIKAGSLFPHYWPER